MWIFYSILSYPVLSYSIPKNVGHDYWIDLWLTNGLQPLFGWFLGLFSSSSSLCSIPGIGDNLRLDQALGKRDVRRETDHLQETSELNKRQKPGQTQSLHPGPAISPLPWEVWAPGPLLPFHQAPASPCFHNMLDWPHQTLHSLRGLLPVDRINFGRPSNLFLNKAPGRC